MKINANQLTAHINKGLAPIYIVSGDEALLQQECTDLLRAAARKAGYSERELHHAEAGYDWNDLLQSANSLSLFSEQKIIELRIPNGKPGDKGSKALQEYIEHLSPDNLLIISMPKLDASQQRSKWFKALDKAGVYVPIWPIDSKQLPGWINQRLKQAGLNAEAEAVQMLAERTEGNLLACVQEIEKLSLFAGDQLIKAETIDKAVSDSARYSVFGLVDAALQGDAEHCARTLNGLRGEGAEPTVILWALSREIRGLVNISRARKEGPQAVDAAMRKAMVWDKRKALVNAAIQRCNERTLRQMLEHCARIDRSVKGMGDDSPWLELSAVSLRLAGVTTPAACY